MSQSAASPPPRDEMECGPQFTLARVIVANLPYLGMLSLGSAILVVGLSGALGWLSGVGYFLYGLLGSLWIMLFVCPYCHFHATRECPCGYGMISAKLRAGRDGDRFAEKFRRHILVIVPLWIVPAAAGVIFAIRQFSWVMLVLLGIFAIDAYIVLPLVSRLHACTSCPQREICPWMRKCQPDARAKEPTS